MFAIFFLKKEGSFENYLCEENEHAYWIISVRRELHRVPKTMLGLYHSIVLGLIVLNCDTSS